MLCIEAYAKINWTLDVLGTQADGYHLMDMLMQTVELHDTLWLEEAEAVTLENASDETGAAKRAQQDALASEAVSFDERNLVYRAAMLLKNRYHVQTGASMRLLKRIPAGAGMGGGSADAAAALKGLNTLWKLGLSQDELLALGLSLGADVPFLLTGGLAHVSGIGEIIVPLSPAPSIPLIMLQPCGGLSTREVFGAFDSLNPSALSRPDTQMAKTALLRRNLPMLASAMNNVLEGVSVKARPALKNASQALEKLGAIRAMMTGSGSVVYGVFDTTEQANNAATKLSSVAQKNGWGRVWTTHTL